MTDLEDIINNSDNYVANGMGQYSIDDETYTGYKDYTFIWEKTYVQSPKRTNDGSMGNLNDIYATFVTPHMTVNYSIMTINDYRRIMKQYLEKNEFVVTCYDPINDKQTTNKMYFATPSTPTFYYLANDNGEVELLGVQNYTVELIGTNNPL